MKYEKIEEIRVNTYIREEIAKIMAKENRGLGSFLEEGLKLCEGHEKELYYSKQFEGFNTSTTVSLTSEGVELLKKLRERHFELSKTDIVCNAFLLIIKKHGAKEQLFRVEGRIHGNSDR